MAKNKKRSHQKSTSSDDVRQRAAPHDSVDGGDAKAVTNADQERQIQKLETRVADGETKIARGERWMITLTAATVLLAFMQWHLGRQQAADARRAVELDQRAWLGIERIEGAPQLGAEWNIAVLLRNSGKTPARDVEAELLIDPQPGRDMPQDASKDGYSGDIQPGGVVTLRLSAPVMDNVTGELKRLDADAMRLLETGAVKMYLRGTVAYSDVFERRHTLPVCHLYSPQLRSFAICRSE